MKSVRITLPLPPNLGNSRMHWRTKQRKRKAYYEWAMVLGLIHAPRTPYAKVRVRATLYVWAKMDADNMMARLKWPLDVLVACGWMVDDGPNHLEFADMPSQVVDRKAQRVEIELEPIA